MRLSGKHKKLVLLGLSVPLLLGVGRWIQLHTPPRGLPEILTALAAPDPEFVGFLQANPEIAQNSMPALYRLRRDSANWKFSHMRTTGDQAQAVIRSSTGQTACLTLHRSRGRLPIPSVWRYIRGATLSQMADSALEVTRSPGIVIGYWKDGREEIEARGVEDLMTKQAMGPGSRFRVTADYPLLQLAVARLAEQGIVPWKTVVSSEVALSDFPVAAKQKTIEDLMFPGNGDVAWPVAVFEPSAKEPFQTERRKFVESAIGVLHSFKRPVVPKGKWPSSISWALVAMTLEARVGLPVSEVIAQHVFEPLQMPDASFEGPVAKPYESQELAEWSSLPNVRTPPQTTPTFAPTPAPDAFTPSMLHHNGVGLTVRDLLALGRFRLQADRGDSTYLNAASLLRTRVQSSPYTTSHLGWGRDNSDRLRNWWLEFRQPGVTAIVIAFPEQNAVVTVAANFQLGSTEYIGGIVARIAERFCDVEY